MVDDRLAKLDLTPVTLTVEVVRHFQDAAVSLVVVVAQMSKHSIAACQTRILRGEKRSACQARSRVIHVDVLAQSEGVDCVSLVRSMQCYSLAQVEVFGSELPSANAQHNRLAMLDSKKCCLYSVFCSRNVVCSRCAFCSVWCHCHV